MTQYCSGQLKFLAFCLAFFSFFDLILTPLPFCCCKKQIDVSFSCVCPVTDYEFCYNIVKVVLNCCTRMTFLSFTSCFVWDTNYLLYVFKLGLLFPLASDNVVM